MIVKIYIINAVLEQNFLIKIKRDQKLSGIKEKSLIRFIFVIIMVNNPSY